MLDLFTYIILPVHCLDPATDGQDTLHLLTILDPDFRYRVAEVSMRVGTLRRLTIQQGLLRIIGQVVHCTSKDVSTS
jgi:hypothetical protein